LALIIAVSCELHHSYVFIASHDVPHSYEIKNISIFFIYLLYGLFLPVFLFIPVKKRTFQEYSKIGFALIGLMVLKLYTYDVWQMDNISRISAFIALGIILLLSSFTFQRLKNIIKNMVDKKRKTQKNG
jgi:uncharacterized membrane protein